MKIEKILLTTDFSPCARRSYAPAVALTRRLGAHLELAHAGGIPYQFGMEALLTLEAQMDTLRRAQAASMEKEALHPALAGLRLTTHLLDGVGPEAVQEFAARENVDLIVQSSHGYTGWRRFVLGSFAERMVRGSPVPVLTFKPSEAGEEETRAEFRPQRILFPFDFSERSRAALDAVRFFAGLYGARVLVVHAWNGLENLVPVFETAGQAVDLELFSGGEDYLKKDQQDLVEFASKELPGLRHEEEVLIGEAATRILARAADFKADLICMATHGWTGLKRMLLGSVTEKVLRRADSPILTLRPALATLKDRVEHGQEATAGT